MTDRTIFARRCHGGKGSGVFPLGRQRGERETTTDWEESNLMLIGFILLNVLLVLSLLGRRPGC
jgi:hypothetical protein